MIGYEIEADTTGSSLAPRRRRGTLHPRRAMIDRLWFWFWRAFLRRDVRPRVVRWGAL